MPSITRRDVAALSRLWKAIRRRHRLIDKMSIEIESRVVGGVADPVHTVNVRVFDTSFKSIGKRSIAEAVYDIISQIRKFQFDYMD